MDEPVTVGRLRAELVGVPDDVALVAWLRSGDTQRARPVAAAGWGEAVDQDDPVLLGVGFPVVVDLEG